jgi:hypothetical protein
MIRLKEIMVMTDYSYALALVGLVVAIAVAAPAGAVAFQDIKIDPNVYTGINARGNPTGALPHDYTWFHFRVAFETRVYQTDESGNLLGPVHTQSEYMGVYDANTVFQNSFPKEYGNPGETGVTRQCMLWGLYCWFQKTVTVYHVDTYDVPAGYCPMYPDGQDYKKGDTTTVVWKFFKGPFCGVYTPPASPTDGPFDHGVIVIR